ncbi:MAG: branched-chain amino acid ABC transporter permease [Gemmatimonadetes bacterium]|jgi:branched-chain amino acid transport system permease protein|nr:branched-chain amino acid ABC transporter permease [Gemmatimonadota bacterium]
MVRWLLLVLMAAVLIFVPTQLKPYGIFLMSNWLIFCVVATGLNLTVGYAGQISLAQAGFMGIGAYTSSILMSRYGIDFWHTLPISAGVSFLFGIMVGYPALRVQHHYLAFATLGFNIIVYLVFRNEDWLTGGAFGIFDIPRPTVFGYPTNDPLAFYYLCLAFTLIMVACAWWIVHSPWGRAFAALRDNPTRAASLGINIRTYTLLAFAIGSTFAGLAGSFYASLLEFIDPYAFAFEYSLSFLLMVISGGSATIVGPLIGAGLVLLMPEWLRFAKEYYLMIYAIFVMVLIAFCPSGVVGLWERFNTYIRHKRMSSAAAAAALKE